MILAKSAFPLPGRGRDTGWLHAGRKSLEKAGRRESTDGTDGTEQAGIPFAGKAWKQKAGTESFLENRKPKKKFVEDMTRIKFLRQARLRMSGHAFTVVDYRALLIFIPHIMADNAVSQ